MVTILVIKCHRVFTVELVHGGRPGDGSKSIRYRGGGLAGLTVACMHVLIIGMPTLQSSRGLFFTPFSMHTVQ